MARAFTFGVMAIDLYQNAVRDIGQILESSGRDEFLQQMSDEQLTDHLVQSRLVEPLEWDSTRSATLGRDQVETIGGRAPIATPQRQPIYVLDLPLVPKPSNVQALAIRPEKGWTARVDITDAAAYGERQGVLRFRGTKDDLQELRSTAQVVVQRINDDIATYFPKLRPDVLGMVKGKRDQLGREDAEFAAAARKLGVELRPRPDAITPVEVRERSEVLELRDQPHQRTGPGDPYLTPESTRKVIDLIDQAGKGFEVAPEEFRKLGEEGLRHVIAGYLNAVFRSTVATAETFSKRGKPDLVIQVRGGAVFVGECKFWDGYELYQRTMVDQLFRRYVTWRHAVAVLVTFSDRMNLSRVVREAKRATSELSSLRGAVKTKNETYFVSTHEHPEDPDKTIEVHHLLFNLYSGEATAADRANAN